MRPFTVPGLLRAAASYIEIHGHEQRLEKIGGANNKTGPCCPIVALRRLQPRTYTKAFYSFACIARLRTGVAEWSDRTPTAEVLATMRRVARELDAR